MIQMWISGEETRVLNAIGMEGWDLERETGSSEEFAPLKAKGSWGGSCRNYYITSNEDGEIESVVREGERKHYFEVGDKVYPVDCEETKDNEAVVIRLNEDSTVDVAGPGGEGVGWEVGEGIARGDLKHPAPHEWAVMNQDAHDEMQAVENLDDYGTREQAEAAAKEKFGAR